jgi:hypothetical protein
VPPHSTLVVVQAEHSGEYASSREYLQRNIFAAGIRADWIRGEVDASGTGNFDPQL